MSTHFHLGIELIERKSPPDKALLAAVLKATTSASNGWLGRRLAMGAPTSASQYAADGCSGPRAGGPSRAASQESRET